MYLPRMCRALSLVPCTAKSKRKAPALGLLFKIVWIFFYPDATKEKWKPNQASIKFASLSLLWPGLPRRDTFVCSAQDWQWPLAFYENFFTGVWDKVQLQKWIIQGLCAVE